MVISFRDTDVVLILVGFGREMYGGSVSNMNIEKELIHKI